MLNKTKNLKRRKELKRVDGILMHEKHEDRIYQMYSKHSQPL